uniref:Uncharacterized protein n=1 Tax=viral metagenome TaxID=1070528 RepID=A0A6M3IJK7_9ZZZZ
MAIKTRASAYEWSTKHELAFIDTLSPKQIQGYAQGALKRIHWGKINSREVYKRIEKYLSNVVS